MPMNLLVLKARQARRILSLIPLPYLCLIAVLLFGLGLILLNQLRQDPNGAIAVGFCLLLLSVYHSRRKDARFIKTFYRKTYPIYLLEYTVLASPLFLLIVLSGHWKLLPFAAAGVVGVACLPQRNGPSGARLLPYARFFPTSYEWVSGCRRSLVYLSAFYLISVGVLFQTYLGIIAYFFLLLVCVSFYGEGESLSLLCLPERGPLAYLRHKIGRAIRNFHRLSLPFYLLFLILYPAKGWLLLWLSLAACLSFAYGICLKYARYIPDEKHIGNGAILCIGILGPVVPFLLPLTLLLGIRYFLLALKNLKLYLDAYDH